MFFNEYYDFQYFNEYFHVILVITLNGEIVCLVRLKNLINTTVNISENEIIMVNSNFRIDIEDSSVLVLTDLSSNGTVVTKYDIETLLVLSKYDGNFTYTINEIKLVVGAYIIDLDLETIVTSIIKE